MEDRGKVPPCVSHVEMARYYNGEAPRTFRNKYVSWLVEKTIEETTSTKDMNPETIEVRVIKNEWNSRLRRRAWHLTVGYSFGGSLLKKEKKKV